MVTKKNKLYELLQMIREKPYLYLRENDVLLLRTFIDGYNAATEHRDDGFFYGFNEYCIEKFQGDSNKEWSSLIADHVPQEKGISTFFTLLDAFLESGTIDEIMDMLDEENPIEIQQCGIEKARSKPVCFFIMPCGVQHIWKNCALIVSQKEDRELKRYLNRLFLWAGDENRFGSDTIYLRLQRFQRDEEFIHELQARIKYAKTDAIRTRLQSLLTSERALQ